MITTNKIKLSPKRLFSILIIRYFKKRWWLIAWMLIFGLFLAFNGIQDSFEIFLIVFSLAYPLILVIQFWRYVNSKDNKLLLLERYYEIDDEKINGIIDKDTNSHVRIEHFIKAELIKNTYLLFMAKNLFIYIPRDSFEIESDLEWFENKIITKIKK